MRTVDLFDGYLSDNLSAEEKLDFETRLIADADFAGAFNEHKTLITALKQKAAREELKKTLGSIHKDIFGNGRIIPITQTTFAKRYGKQPLLLLQQRFLLC